MKHISTLVVDIQYQLKQKDGWFSDQLAKEFSSEITSRLTASLGAPDRKPTLRLSQMGPKCPKALWYSIHHPEMAEPLPASALFKYSFGHIIEGLAISLAKAAGHEVTGEQDELTVDGIKGHRDCVIDGCIVDVKSAASQSFVKFRNGLIRNQDSFGYLDQLDGYLVGSADDPLVRVKDRAYLLVIDKQLGHMCLYEHHLRPGLINKRISDYKSIVERDKPPACTCNTKPEGAFGNIKLAFPANYSAFKFACFPHLRTFLYAGKDGGPKEPIFLTQVVKKPNVTEVDKYGKVVYN